MSPKSGHTPNPMGFPWGWGSQGCWHVRFGEQNLWNCTHAGVTFIRQILALEAALAKTTSVTRAHFRAAACVPPTLVLGIHADPGTDQLPTLIFFFL